MWNVEIIEKAVAYESNTFCCLIFLDIRRWKVLLFVQENYKDVVMGLNSSYAIRGDWCCYTAGLRLLI